MIQQQGLMASARQRSSDGGSVVIEVHVVPRASRSEVVSMVEGVLKIRLTSPPVDGAANVELIGLLAKRLKIPKTDIAIVRGTTSRYKIVRITGVVDLIRLTEGGR